MSFWDEVKKGLEEGAQALKKGAEAVAEKTEEAAKIARLRYSIYTVRQGIRKTFTELGAHVFELAERGKPSVWEDEAVLSYVQDVRDARQKILELEEQIRSIAQKEEPTPEGGNEEPSPEGGAVTDVSEDDERL